MNKLRDKAPLDNASLSHGAGISDLRVGVFFTFLVFGGAS